MKRLYILPISLLLMIACKSKKEPLTTAKPNAPQAVVVDVIIASPQPITNSVEANGTVVANESVDLHPEVSGRLTFLNIPEGGYIKQGTVIAKINDADLQAQLNKSKVALELANKTEERLRKLLSIQGVNQADYDIAVSQINGYKADIAYTHSLIDKTVLKAPFSGVVGLRQISLGAYVSPATILATLQQLDKVKIDFTIPEEYSKLIRKGNSVDVQTDAAKQNKTRAVIIATEPQVNQSTRNLKVRAVLQDNKVNLGAYVKVFITSGKDVRGLLVPTNSIIPDDKNKQLVLVKAGKAAFTNIETGARQAGNVEVTKGLKEGDTVVVTGVLFTKPKSQLKVRSVKTLDQVTNN
ncbi:MAG: efflux RND transporter periplasmic adaptor subunit [Sediminibacterium sp.]